ncbi:MAG: helix-turn-helix transcriptional regulator [Firmicutes bacterium]|nr:helix-turn-helix transcriptional regulator [Bacillota bacterium]
MQYYEERSVRAERFSKIWWKSRAESGRSQEYMGLSIGVSKRTIQNWERGISSPNLLQGIEWFRVLNINPLHYFMEFMYPDAFDDDADDDKTEQVLIELIKQCTSLEKKQLLYLITGDHGSTWHALLQMVTAHCHTTMQSRVSAARIIAENFEIEEQTGQLVCKDAVMPNIDYLKCAINEGKLCAKNKQNSLPLMSIIDKP